MALSDAAREQLNTLSDTLLYSEACQFIAQNGTIDGQSQMHAALQIAQDWDQFKKFVTHQARRDWGRRRSHYGPFYADLDRYLNKLKQRIKKGDLQPPKDVSRQIWKNMILQEFIEHLVAENLWQEKVQ
ncbi:MAG: hypothetical protein ACPG8W_15360 [Candidatus Promineifilaceae bacterium]